MQCFAGYRFCETWATRRAAPSEGLSGSVARRSHFYPSPPAPPGERGSDAISELSPLAAHFARMARLVHKPSRAISRSHQSSMRTSQTTDSIWTRHTRRMSTPSGSIGEPAPNCHRACRKTPAPAPLSPEALHIAQLDFIVAANHIGQFRQLDRDAACSSRQLSVFQLRRRSAADTARSGRARSRRTRS